MALVDEYFSLRIRYSDFCSIMIVLDISDKRVGIEIEGFSKVLFILDRVFFVHFETIISIERKIE